MKWNHMSKAKKIDFVIGTPNMFQKTMRLAAFSVLYDIWITQKNQLKYPEYLLTQLKTTT